MNPAAEIGVIGGSGLYALLEDAEEHEVSTPYGAPSDPITVARVKVRQDRKARDDRDGHDDRDDRDDHDDHDGENGKNGLNDRTVAFLPRHGRDHRFPPHKIPYRANLWALRSLGVRQIVAPCAVGSLRPELGPGSFVVPDQLIDRTSGRVQTFYDTGAVHINFADPYCPDGRAAVLEAARAVDATDGGTMVVVEGPRFSTRAESRWFTSIGGTIVNMTGHPEAVLARELGLCYTTIALVTDLDAGVEGDHGVTMDEVFRVFRENTARLRGVLLEAVTKLPTVRKCVCSTALDGLKLPIDLP